MNPRAIALLCATFIAGSAAAQTVRHEPASVTPLPAHAYWFVAQVPAWNDAAAALIEQNGNMDVSIVPLETGKWLVIRKQMLAGDVVMNSGFGSKSFTSALDAASFYDPMPPGATRRMFDWHDGSVVVVWDCTNGVKGFGCPWWAFDGLSPSHALA